MELETAIEELDDILFEVIMDQYQKLSSQAIDPDLKMKEHMVIEFLGRKEAAKMSKLASFFSVPPTTMTSIIDRLVKKGYLERRRSEEDRRVVLVTLSQQGEEFFAQHEKESHQGIKNIFSCLTEEELKQLVSIFTKLRNRYQSE